MEICRVQGLTILMLNKIEKLFKGTRQVFALLPTLLKKFGSKRGHLRLDSGARCCRNSRLDGVESQSDIIENLLLEALVLGKGRQNLGWYNVQNRL